MFLLKTLYQFIKDSFVAPSISVIKNSHIFQKNSVYPKPFYLHSFLLLTSTSLQNLTSYNKKLLQKSLYTQQKKFSSLMRDCNLPTFTVNYSQTCSNDHSQDDLYKTTTHLRWPILDLPELIPIQSLLYKTTTSLTRPATTFFASQIKKNLSKTTITKLYPAKKSETNIRQ